SSFGGTPAEAWTSRQALAASPTLKHMLDAGPDKLRPATRIWESESHPVTGPPADPGNEGIKRGWARPDFATSGWDSLLLPSTWERELPERFAGVIWLRKEVTVPADWVGQTLTLYLGASADCDTAYV